MTLGENIVRLRTQKNWSQGDLADALEISRQSVSKWETDASIPELDKLLKLSELFGVTLDELVRGEEVPKTETAMPAAQTVPTSFAPQATPEREKRRTIAGTVLLCTGAVILVFCLLLAGDLLTGLLFASPFLICGIICFAVKQRVGLCCGWAVYLCVDLYLRFATGLSWTTIFMTHLWTAQMNKVLCKNENSISVIQWVWDFPKNENRAFRRSAGTLCFSGVGTHRICLLLCKEILIAPRRFSQVYLHLLCLLFL